MDLIGKLLEKLNAHKVRYVHWKSNTNIDCALSGVDDFDVLVAPEYKKTVENFFKELKITRAFCDKDSWQEDIFHYIGFDHEYLKLAHVHVHYQLPVGYDFDKNFKLPIVDCYLANPVQYKNVFIPEVEKEYIVLVVRLILKNALTPFLLKLPTAQLRLMSNVKLNGVVSGGGYKEFIDLKSRSNQARVDELLNNEMNFVSPIIFRACEAVLKDNKSLVDYFKVGRRLKSELKEYRNNAELKSLLLSFCRINKGRIDKLSAKFSGVFKAKKIPSTGGRIIAFVGGDGAGKTTNIERLRKKLSRHFWVEKIHIGLPPNSIIGLSWKVLSRISALLGFKDLGRALFYIAWASNRLSAFNRACSVRDKGGLVILDRIPLPGITAMDCPRVATLGDGKFKRLIAHEKAIYNKIRGVDLLFVLKLNPEEALKRRPEDDPNELRIRSGQIWNNDWHAPYAIQINTGENTFEQVEQTILENVGNHLSRKYICSEILGLTGAGKSTLLASIVDRVPNTRITLPFKQYPLQTLLGVAKSARASCKVLLASHSFLCFKNTCQFYASIEIFKYWHKKGSHGSNNYVLDQGPLFQLALMLKEKAISEAQGKPFFELIHAVMPISYMLQIDDASLWQRTQQRQNHTGRGQQCRSIEEFSAFLLEYKTAFAQIHEASDLIEVVDANNHSPQELSNKLMGVLGFGQ